MPNNHKYCQLAYKDVYHSFYIKSPPVLEIQKERESFFSFYQTIFLKLAQPNTFLSPTPNPLPQGRGLEFYFWLAFRPLRGLARHFIFFKIFINKVNYTLPD
jgi:hypothetical protein